MTGTKGKTERLHFRVRPELRKMIEKAASYKGLTLSEFALTALSSAATRTIDKHER